MALKTVFCLLTGLSVLFLAACSPFAGIPITGDDQTLGVEPGLVGTRWRLVSYGQPGSETPVLDGTEVTIQFKQDNQAEGFAGCHLFSAQYAAPGDSLLSFTELASDGMPCTSESFLDQEKQVLEALRAAESFELSGESLVIHYGNRVLSFWKVTSPPPNSVHI